MCQPCENNLACPMFNHLHPYGMCRVDDEMFSPPPTFVNITKMFVTYFYLLHLD